MADGNGNSGAVRASNIDVLTAVQRLEISMTERFARLETSYTHVAERLVRIETQYEGMRDTLRNIETSQAGADAGMAELRRTTAELEKDVAGRVNDFEARLRTLERSATQTSVYLALGAVAASLVLERVVLPLVLR